MRDVISILQTMSGFRHDYVRPNAFHGRITPTDHQGGVTLVTGVDPVSCATFQKISFFQVRHNSVEVSFGIAGDREV